MKLLPLQSEQCPLCGAPLALGVTHDGKRVLLDLGVKVFALVGTRPLEIVATSMAAPAHGDICPYKDAQ